MRKFGNNEKNTNESRRYDTFEENAEKLIKQGKSQKDAYENPNRHNFFLPRDA
jgi:hypothetical protein